MAVIFGLPSRPAWQLCQQHGAGTQTLPAAAQPAPACCPALLASAGNKDEPLLPSCYQRNSCLVALLFTVKVQVGSCHCRDPSHGLYQENLQRLEQL